MPLSITSLTELDPALIAQVQAGMTQLIQERHPEIELGRGVFHDLVLHFSSVCNAVVRTEIARVLASRSLLAISQDPQLSDPILVDHVLSNFGITRKQGATATGQLTIVVTGDSNVVLSRNTVYVANGANYKLDAAYIAKPPGSQLFADNERLLEPRGDGTFTFTIPATAVATGVGGNLRRGTRFATEQPPARFVMAFAATDFAGGADTELNSALLQRLQLGVAAKVLCGRTNIEALFREQSQFGNTLHYSIIGFGNPEMQRDQHWIWPMSGGGRIDIYARTTALPQHVSLTKTATLIGRQGTTGIWQFAINRDDAPGFYEVLQILHLTDPPETAGFEILSDTRGRDLPETGIVPDVLTVTEAAYTAYQTAVIQFLDTETHVTDADLYATAAYSVVVETMPLIAELQLFTLDAKYRTLSADILVKAPVPCFLTINCDIEQAAGEPALDLAAIKMAIANLVNTQDFPGQLHASSIADVIHNFLSDRQAVGPIDMRGRIRRPDGHMLYVQSPSVLILPDSPSTLTTGRTTAFLLDPADIGLSVVTRGFGRNA